MSIKIKIFHVKPRELNKKVNPCTCSFRAKGKAKKQIALFSLELKTAGGKAFFRRGGQLVRKIPFQRTISDKYANFDKDFVIEIDSADKNKVIQMEVILDVRKTPLGSPKRDFLFYKP